MSTPYSKYAAQRTRGARTRPERIEAKPLRHPGRWVLAALLAGWLVARNGLRPLRRLTSAVERIAVTEDLRPLRVDDAEAMAAATVKGAGIMLQQEGARAEALRKAVMSPNGTTEKAVEAFLDGGMGDLVNRAMDAAAQRDKEMAEEFGA